MRVLQLLALVPALASASHSSVVRELEHALTEVNFLEVGLPAAVDMNMTSNSTKGAKEEAQEQPVVAAAKDANMTAASKEGEKAAPVKEQATPAKEKEQAAPANATASPDVPQGAVLNAASQQAGCTSLRNFLNAQYTVQVSVGTPEQKFWVIPDTGSSELVLNSKECDFCPPEKPAYAANLSTSAKITDQAYTISYGQGVVSTQKTYDTIHMGSVEAKEATILEIKAEMLRGFAESSYEGILGMSKFNVSQLDKTDNGATWLAQADVSQVSVCLSREDDQPGIIQLGALPNAMSTLNFREVPVVGDHHWAVNLTKVYAEGKESSVCSSGCVALVDSGTTLIGVPQPLLVSINEQIGEIKEDCSNLDTLPIVKFQMGDQEVEVPPSMYVMNLTAEHDDVIVKMQKRYSHSTKVKAMQKRFAQFHQENPTAAQYPSICMSAFMDLDLNSQFGPVFILGMPIMRQYFTVFNRESKTIAFTDAGSVNCGSCGYATSVNTQFVSGEKEQSRKALPIKAEAIHLPQWAFGSDSDSYMSL